jgi:hypothetical protein
MESAWDDFADLGCRNHSLTPQRSEVESWRSARLGKEEE